MKAFAIWKKEGCPQGRYLQHWLNAVKQAEAENHPAGSLARKGGDAGNS
ncbi:MAG: DUF2934 domain-containing protein [Verrucomicrobia bacterium]|nr:DUF2934 domain-containing protein [Verrucomicrobiota bacterium]